MTFAHIIAWSSAFVVQLINKYTLSTSWIGYIKHFESSLAIFSFVLKAFISCHHEIDTDIRLIFQVFYSFLSNVSEFYNKIHRKYINKITNFKAKVGHFWQRNSTQSSKLKKPKPNKNHWRPLNCIRRIGGMQCRNVLRTVTWHNSFWFEVIKYRWSPDIQINSNFSRC